MGNGKENISSLQYINKPHVEHIKNGSNNLSKTRQGMKQVKYLGIEENVWEMSPWNGEEITKLWSTI